MKKLLAFLLMAAMILGSFALVGCNIDLSIDGDPNVDANVDDNAEPTVAGKEYEVKDELTYDGSEEIGRASCRERV